MKKFLSTLTIKQFSNITIFLFLLFLWLFSASPAFAAVAVDGTPATNTGTGTTIDVTYTVSASSNRLMLVGISSDASAVGVTSVVWDPTGANESLTLVTSCNRTSSNGEMWIYYLTAPTAGTSKTLRATLTSNSTGSVVGVITFSGVNQSTPLGTCVTDSADPANLSVTVSSETGGMVFDTAASDENITAGAGQTVQWDVTTPANGAASTKAGASSVTMTYSGGSTGGSMGAVPIKAAASGFNISGTVYLENESTTATSGNGGQCDGSTANLSLRVNGGTASTTSCSSSDASFTFSSITASAGDTITIYSTATDKSNRAYVTDGAADTGMNLYKNALAIGDENDGTVTNADLADWDNDNDATNLLFTANTNNLTVESGVELHIHTSDTYDPGGTIDTNTTGGDLHVDDSATAYIDTATSTIGADALVDTGATLYIDVNTNIDGGDITLSGSGSVNYSTGTPTVTLSGAGTIGGGTGTLTFYNLTIDSTGTTTLNAALTVSNNLTVGDGTNAHTLDVETNDKTVDVNGSVTIAANGTLTASSTGTFTIAGSWTNNGTLTEGTGTITFDSATAATLNSGCSDADACTTQNFYNLTINKTNSTDTVTLSTNHLRVGNTLTITTGRLVQSTLNIRAEGATAVSVGANGTWRNISTGDIKLNGNVSNSGTVTLTANNTCGGTDDIVITAVSGTPSWSGSGTYTFKDTSLTSQNAAVAITVYSGTNVSGNTGSWTFNAGCSITHTNSTFSLSAWVNPTSSIATKAILVKNAEIRLVTDGSGNPLCQISNTASWQTAATSGTAITTGTWSHVACTYDKVTLRVFVNGVQTGTSSLTVAIDDTTNSWRFGSDQGGTYGDYNGTMDDVRLYNYARSVKDLVEDVNAGHPAPGSPVGSAVAHWKFDEGRDGACSGGTNDACNSGSSGSTLDGAQSNMAVPATSTSGWTNSGKFGKALLFDGTDDVVRITEAAAVDLGATTDSYTVSAWIKTSADYTVAGYVVAKLLTSSTFPYLLYIDTTEFACFANNDGTNTSTACGTTALNDGNWHHLLGIRNVTDDKVYIYVDGKQVGSATDTSTATTANNDDVSIGNGSTSYTSRDFNGTIDEPKIYNFALTSDQVKLDYNRGQAVVYGALSDNSSYQPQAANQEYCVPGDSTSCAAPVAEWKMEEASWTNNCSTDSVFDTSGNGYHGDSCPNSTGPTTMTVGKIGRAGSFDGSDDRVDIPSTFQVPSQQGTASVWVYPISANYDILGAGVGGNDFRLDATDNVYGFFISGEYRVSYATDPTSNTWTYLTLTWDQTNGSILYYNGSRVASNSSAPPAFSQTGMTIAHNPGGGTYLQGYVDELKFYNYARTPAQIAWDYSRGSPVGHWKFDECQGATANDSAGNSLSGTISAGSGGVTSVGDCTTTSTMWDNGESGKWNYSLDFDSTDDVVTVTNASKIDFNEGLQNGMTMAAWFYADTAGEGGAGRIFAKEPAAGDGTLCYVNNLSGSNLDVYCTLDLTTTNRSVTVSTAVTTASWNHVAFTWTNDSDDDVKVYINGKNRGSSSTNSNDTIPTDTTNFTIGNNTAGSGTFDGKIDDVRIYNYELTGTQIKLLYNQASAVRFGPATGSP